MKELFFKNGYIDRVVELIGCRSTDFLLDIASETGGFGRAIAPFVRVSVCVDDDPERLMEGKRLADSEGVKNIEFIGGQLDSIPFYGPTFDTAVSCFALHRTGDCATLFGEMHRTLKRGGRIAVIDWVSDEDGLSEARGRIQAMIGSSREKNRSPEELLSLYDRFSMTVCACEELTVCLSLQDWLSRERVATDAAQRIRAMLENELSGGEKTGFYPKICDGEICIERRFAVLVGELT